MIFSFDLLINAVISGLLIGGFYAAVTSGISLSFGILDIVNIAHPGFIVLGSYVAYIINTTFGLDPILTSIIMTPVFYAPPLRGADRNRCVGWRSSSACCSLPK